METYVIDAKGKKLGRVATEAANVLRGKDSPAYKPNMVSGRPVKIVNASLVDLSQAKLDEKYSKYSGYPGGLTFEKRGKVIDRLGYQVVFERAVRGMLPNNKLRKPTMKMLEIVD